MQDELLVLLIEECGEVIQAATKCLRFGFERLQPSYGVNCLVLAQEVGDVLGVVDALHLDIRLMEQCRLTKIQRAEEAKTKYGASHV